MRKKLLDIICCPVCKSPFDVVEERVEIEVVNEKEEEVIVEGKLICRGCGREYPIKEGIPVLLPPELAEEVERG